MRKKILCACFTPLPLVILVLVLTRLVSPAAQNPTSEPKLLDALDGCIQERFLDIDKYFGMRRIMKGGESPHRFKPENAKELQAVTALNDQGMSTALYLASRKVLGKEPDAKEWEAAARGTGLGYPQRLIQGPVWITTKTRDDLPKPSELWAQSREAMMAFAKKDEVTFSYGNWKFIARPVRASEASCLKCHMSEPNSEKKLAIGDPLGVVLYAYQKEPGK